MLDFTVYLLPEVKRFNACLNPSFEVDLSNWYQGSAFSIARSTAQSVHGAASLLATVNSTNGLRYVSTDFLTVEPESVHTISVYVRPSKTVNFRIEATWYRTNNYGTLIRTTSYADSSCLLNTWTRISAVVTVPVNATAVEYQVVWGDTLSLGDNFYIDAALIEETDEVGDYFDGDYHPTYADPIQDEQSGWYGIAGTSASYFLYRTREQLQSIQEIDFMTGRRSMVDMTSAGNCSFQIFNPTAIPPLGALIEVYYDTYLLWVGRVADTERVYGMIADTDILQVSCEGYLASAGRAEVTVTAQTDVNLQTLAVNACSSAQLSAQSVPTTSITASHNAYQGNLLSYLQRLQMTGYGRLKESRETLFLVPKDSQPFEQRGGGFTDGAPSVTQSVFNDLRFASRADTYYDSVRVETETDGAGTHGDGSQTLVVSTYNSSQTDATNLAAYILDAYSNAALGPSQISINVNRQTNDYWAQILDINQALGEPDGAGGPVYQRQQVTFRSVTHKMIIEGAQLSASPDSCRVTFFLSIADFPYLILDDATYGLLGSGRLG